MVVADNAAAALEPFDVDFVRNIAADPHQEDENDAEGEREAQIVMPESRQLRPGGEGFRPDQRQQQRPPERDVEPRDRQDDEAGRGHPMHEALERVEAHDFAPRTPAFEFHHSTHEIENNQHCQNAEDGDAADPFQSDGAEFAPIAPGWMLEHVGFHIRDGAAALDLVELLEQLLLLYRVGGRIDRARLLRRGRQCRCDHER